MPLIIWDLKRAIPVWLFMLAASVWLGFTFVENGGFAVYSAPDATRASLFIPPLLGLLIFVMLYSLISLRHFAIVQLADGHFIFRNGLTSVAVPAGENSLIVVLDAKERIRRALVMSPEGALLHQLSFRVMKFACTPEDVPPEYKVETIMPGAPGAF